MISYIFLSMTFLLFLVFSLGLTRSDWGSPAVIVSAAFLLCSLAGLYNVSKYGIELSMHATMLIAGLVACFVLLSLFVSVCYRGSLKRVSGSGHEIELVLINLPRFVIRLCIGLAVLTLISHVADTLSSFSIIGGSGDWNESMNSYRTSLAYGEAAEGAGSSSISNALFKLLSPVSFIFMYIGINNSLASKKLSLHLLVMLFPAICYLLCEIATGVRLGAIRMICAALVLAWVLWSKQHGWTKKILVGAIVRAILLIAVACVLFWLLAWVVGRQVELGLLDYICSYIGFSFISFDLFLQHPLATRDLFGAETFVAIYGFLGRLLGDDGLIYSGNNEFRSWHGIGLGNVYTSFRTWYSDFGLAGTVVLCLICSLVMTLVYERCRSKDDKNGISFSLVVYSYFAAGLFAMPLVSLLTQTALQVTTVFELLMIYVLIRVFDRYKKPLNATGTEIRPRIPSFSPPNNSHRYECRKRGERA